MKNSTHHSNSPIPQFFCRSFLGKPGNHLLQETAVGGRGDYLRLHKSCQTEKNANACPDSPMRERMSDEGTHMVDWESGAKYHIWVALKVFHGSVSCRYVWFKVRFRYSVRRTALNAQRQTQQTIFPATSVFVRLLHGEHQWWFQVARQNYNRICQISFACDAKRQKQQTQQGKRTLIKGEPELTDPFNLLLS